MCGWKIYRRWRCDDSEQAFSQSLSFYWVRPVEPRSSFSICRLWWQLLSMILKYNLVWNINSFFRENHYWASVSANTPNNVRDLVGGLCRDESIDAEWDNPPARANKGWTGVSTASGILKICSLDILVLPIHQHTERKKSQAGSAGQTSWIITDLWHISVKHLHEIVFLPPLPPLPIGVLFKSAGAVWAKLVARAASQWCELGELMEVLSIQPSRTAQVFFLIYHAEILCARQSHGCCGGDEGRVSIRK